MLAWLVISVMYGLALIYGMSRRGQAVDATAVLVETTTAWLPWGLYSWVVHLAATRQAQRLRFRSFVEFLAGSMLVFQPIAIVTYSQLRAWSAGEAAPSIWQSLVDYPPHFLLADLTLMTATVGVLLTWVVMQRNHEYERERRKAEAALLTLRVQLEEQRLARLQAQLEPHFMFNALNAITGLVRQNDQAATLSAIAKLSDLLRYALRGTHSEWVSIVDECRFIDDYLALQRLRFGDRLQVLIELPDALRLFPCPVLLLQPLVENAVRHGIECLRAPGLITIAACAGGSGVEITISNPCPPGSTSPGFGIGLGSVQERIALLYRGKASLQTTASEGHFVVQLHLPELDDE